MLLVSDKTIKIFDLTAIKRSDCIRIKRAGDTTFRNGFVTRATEQTIEIMYSNTQNNATSYMQILAADVAAGIWEIYWTTDFITINNSNSQRKRRAYARPRLMGEQNGQHSTGLQNQGGDGSDA